MLPIDLDLGWSPYSLGNCALKFVNLSKSQKGSTLCQLFMLLGLVYLSFFPLNSNLVARIILKDSKQHPY